MDSLEILVCTIDDRINAVGQLLLPPADGISYLISWQQSDDREQTLPEVLSRRDDVRVVSLAGHGLSANRNNALRHATADILLIADDDCRYTPDYFDTVRRAFATHPEADIITFQGIGFDFQPLHDYSLHPYPYDQRPYGSYVSSWEIAMRRSPRLPRFDERFGLGSPMLGCGEEEVFVHEAAAQGLTVIYLPQVIVQTERQTTGRLFLSSPAIQRAKGGVLCFMHGQAGALLRSIKFVISLPRTAHRLSIMREMIKGIRYISTTRS